jgi:hypothetical protein
LFEHSYLWWLVFGIASLLLSDGVRSSIKTFVRWLRRPAQPRQMAPSVATTETATAAPAGWWWERWWERRRAKREALRKARAEEIKKGGEGALLLEVETWRYLQVLFIWLVVFVVLAAVVYFAPEIAGFLGKVKTSGMVGSHELPWAVMKAREWIAYTLQIPIIGLLIIVGIIIGYGVRDETSLLFFMFMLLVTVLVGVGLIHWKGFNIFLIPSGKAFGSASIQSVPIPLGIFAPLFVAALWFFALKQKPDAVLFLIIVLCLAIFL